MRLIDADELKIDFGFTWDDIAPTREEMFEIIDRQPTAEPKTGKWMFPDPPIHKPICSECGEPCIGVHAFDYKLTPYCPNCGAKMEE